MAYGMTPEGFVPKRLAEIQDSITTGISNILDGNNEQPFINASDDSILQQIIGIFSEALSEAWNAAYIGSMQFDPLKNTGAGQSGTVQLNAMLRKPGTAAILLVQLTGTPGTLVPQGSQISTPDGQHIYGIMAAATIGTDGTVSVLAEETEYSEFAPDPNTVFQIVTVLPGGGWTGASNLAIEAEGTLEETDAALRWRQQRSTMLTSYRLIESIYAAVMNVPGVIYCRAYQNAEKNPVDERGIPFKEVAVVAEGGDPEEICRQLFLRFPTGQIGYGNTTYTFYDRMGYPNPISFSRPVDVDIYVAITIRITNRADYPDEGIELIQQNIVDFAQYGGVGLGNGFPPGASIIRSRLYTPVNQVGGHSIESLLIGRAANALSANDIELSWMQVGRFDPSRITVTIR